MEKEADVSNLSSEGLQGGDAIKSGRCSDKKMMCICHAEQPTGERASTEVHDGVGVAFNHTTAVLRFVLVLMKRFRFMLGNEKGMEKVSIFLEISISHHL